MAHIDRELIVWPDGDGYEGLQELEWSRDESAADDIVGLPQAGAIFSAVLIAMGVDPPYVADNHNHLMAALRRRLVHPDSAT